MDIKLKSNKKIGLCIVGVITALFAVGFMSLYPTFEEKAQIHEQSGIKDEEFLQRLYCSNFVLYKDLMEKTEQTNYNYAQLYLDKEEVKLENGLSIDSLNYVEGNLDEFVSQVEADVESVMRNWEAQMRSELSQSVDYCIVDRISGELMKNTGNQIEALIKGGENVESVKQSYVYYVMVDYDNAGHLTQVSVKGSEAEALLKSAQYVMAGKSQDYFYGDFGYLANGWGSYCGYSNQDEWEKSVEFQLGSPKNVTIVYAMSQSQKDLMLYDGNSSSNWDEWYAYYLAGVDNVYRMFLLALTVVIFLCMKYKKYELHHSKWVRIPLEASVVIVIFIMGCFGESVVGLVSDTNRGYLGKTYEQYLPFLPVQGYSVLTMVINFMFLCLLFGGWSYTVNTWGEVSTLGVKGYLKQRSILVKWWLRFRAFCKKQYVSFKDEILHVNLGKETGRTLRKAVILNFVILAVMCSMWFFGWVALVLYSVALYWLLKRYIHKIQEQYQRLLKATKSIAQGNLNTSFDEDLGVFESYKEELYQIQQGFSKAVEEEVKSQRMKTELITNVSHDLKTPLTAITTYIDLLKEENVTEEQRKEYLAVLEKKSLRLKTLIEDLFEVSKANSRNVTIQLVDVDICNLLRQVYLEYEDRVKEADLTFRFRTPEEKIILSLDSQKTYRIFENLYINIIKYAMPGSRVYVDVEKEEKGVRIELKNMSAVELKVEPVELTERFVRGDSSRNTEGSGLGLAIAKSFAEVQGGKLELCVDGDLFKVTIWFG